MKALLGPGIHGEVLPLIEAYRLPPPGDKGRGRMNRPKTGSSFRHRALDDRSVVL
jgi:hypothetical protein